MNSWTAPAFGVLLLWGTYSIFGGKATAVHGDRVSLAFEAAGFLVLALIFGVGARGDFGKITAQSALFASIMALFSAAGFYLLLMALQRAPEQVGVITLITGAYPAVTMVIIELIVRLKPALMPEAEPLTPGKWIGVALVLSGLAVINWKPEWSGWLVKLLPNAS